MVDQLVFVPETVGENQKLVSGAIQPLPLLHQAMPIPARNNAFNMPEVDL